jgi:hypothetical protein
MKNCLLVLYLLLIYLFKNPSQGGSIIRVAAASDTPASSTSKTGRHDIAEILLKVVSSTKNQSIKICIIVYLY